MVELVHAVVLQTGELNIFMHCERSMLVQKIIGKNCLRVSVKFISV